MELLKLEEFAGGALQEKANAAMQRVLENMQDPNTPYKIDGDTVDMQTGEIITDNSKVVDLRRAAL